MAGGAWGEAAGEEGLRREATSEPVALIVDEGDQYGQRYTLDFQCSRSSKRHSPPLDRVSGGLVSKALDMFCINGVKVANARARNAIRGGSVG